MAAARRAVITGIGVITPLGMDVPSFRQALRSGTSGIRPIKSFDPSGLPFRIGGEVADFDVRNYLDKKDRKRLTIMARTTQFAVAAARLAVDDARLHNDAVDHERFGVAFGAGTIPGDPVDLAPAGRASVSGPASVDLKKWGSSSMPIIRPTWLLNHIPNMPACHVSINHNAQGPNNTITQTDAASLLAVGEAFRVLCRDAADVVLAGGGDTRVNPLSCIRQYLYNELSCRNEEPAKACRPFERNRDGAVLGEGGAAFVVEDLEHARRRGARLYAEIVGFGAAFDRRRDGAGLACAIQAALVEAGISADALDHVNAHGCGTKVGDVWEAQGIAAALGGVSVPVFAPKSYFGDLGVSAGAAELAASLVAMEDGILPATLNYDEADPACPIAVMPTQRPVTRPFFLKINRTDQGQCAAMVLRHLLGNANA